MKLSITAFILVFILLFSASCSSRPPAAPTHETTFYPDSSFSGKPLSGKRNTIVQTAIQNIGQSYTWGGHTPEKGFDCSGLVFYAHQQAGLHVPRTARTQFSNGKIIGMKALLPADLVFFKHPTKKTNFHVGIYIGTEKFIHAPGTGKPVTIASLANTYFRQNFIGARSYISQSPED